VTPHRAIPVAEHTRGRVLVVDDEVAVGRTIERALRDEHEVTLVSDSREALRLLTSPGARYDLVFCDLSMPHVNGAQLHERVRTHDPSMVERFVFITGGAVDESLKTFLAATPNECLPKPFRNIESVRVIARRYVAANGWRTSHAS
jgi:CheY-like chemotaxis protein